MAAEAQGEMTDGDLIPVYIMGNSLLEITVFGWRVGRSVAAYAQQAQPARLSLARVAAWNWELDEVGVETIIKSPMLLPEYARRASA